MTESGRVGLAELWYLGTRDEIVELCREATIWHLALDLRGSNALLMQGVMNRRRPTTGSCDSEQSRSRKWAHSSVG